MRNAGAAVGDMTDFFVMEVPSSGMVADETFISLSKTAGPSRIAKDVGEILGSPEMKGKKILLYGPNSKKTSRVAIDALDLSKETDLTGFTFLFCGDKSDFERIKKEAVSFEGDLIFVEHPTPSR